MSSEYCSHCYAEGVFTQPDITADEMQALVEEKLRSMHFPGFLARRFAKDVPTLRRWRNTTGSQRSAAASSSELQARA